MVTLRHSFVMSRLFDLPPSSYSQLIDYLYCVGVGGVFNGKDAYEKIKAGASMIQIYTSLIYEGPPIVTRIKKELADLIVADGYANVTDCIGISNKV